MRVSVLCVGRPRHAGLADAIRDYETRAGRYWAIEIAEVKEESGRALAGAQVREREGIRMMERVGDRGGDRLVACDPSGESLSSERFAGWLGDLRDRAGSVTFAIGGAHGLGDAVLSRSVRRLSLAPWILPHELARLVLAEQLYRAGTILRGEPYHK